jgi:uncharacterized iron-regulated membrane protein
LKFKKINSWLHLWLGLISGIIVVNICLTGCIWIFNEEINSILKPETRIEQQDKILSPSQFKAIAQKEYPGMKINSLIFQKGRTVNINLGERKKTNITLYVNPYTGSVVRKEIRQPGETDFFRFILNGHRFLWLPSEIGRPIVNYATLTFVIILITGLIWWWPKKWNKSTRQRIFKIKWGASFKRVNYDFHTVFGFYSLVVLLAIALTGMVWGIKWYSEGLYWVTSGGKSLPKSPKLKSDSLQVNKFYTPDQAIDQAFAIVAQKHPKAEGFFYSFPDPSKQTSIISITSYPNSGQFYNNKSYKFDQHTLKQLKGDEVFETAFEEAPFASKLRRMNYDIHIGTVLGFPGKVLVFCCALIGGSLPVTGFIMWWGRKFGKKKKGNAKKMKGEEERIKKKKFLRRFQPLRKTKEPVPVLPLKRIKKKAEEKVNE